MKERKAKVLGRPLTPAEIASNFTRGMVAAGLLSAVQDRKATGQPGNRMVVRHALQGGVALAAGVATAESLREQNYVGALAALAAGTLGVIALETLLASEPTETIEPAEEAEIG